MIEPAQAELSEASHVPENVVKEMEGAYGTIHIIKTAQGSSSTDEDVHLLVARILLLKHKRLLSGDPLG